MYIVGSHISDDEIPKAVAEITKFIEGSGGTVEKHEELGKRKLAYPIKKTRNGFYVVDVFASPSAKIHEIEQKIRSSQNIIRHLITNIEEALVRQEKDRVVQSKLKPRMTPAETKETEQPARATTKNEKRIQIDLDAEIEKALESEDLK
jgi:small subunit ribosomal protein S6